MDHWWGLATGALGIVGFVVAFLLASRQNRERAGLTTSQEIELRKLLASPTHGDGTPMTVAEVIDRICQILDVDLVIPPATTEQR